MKKIVVISILMLSISTFAKMYQYKDSNGTIYFVDDINKVPDNKIDSAVAVNSRFLPTKIEEIDKMRKIVIKNKVYYKEFENQIFALKAWAQLIVNSGNISFKTVQNRLSSIDIESYNTKKKKVLLAKQLSNYFKVFENEWVNSYEILNFISSGDSDIDSLRKNYKKLPTAPENVEERIGLVEKWGNELLLKQKGDQKFIKESLKELNDRYDIPNPDIPELVKFVDKLITEYEKEQNQ
ncbi:hypothetical protein JXR93_10555 [bacterium]|nr:hypothetical protein [bacterium]